MRAESAYKTLAAYMASINMSKFILAMRAESVCMASIDSCPVACRQAGAMCW